MTTNQADQLETDRTSTFEIPSNVLLEDISVLSETAKQKDVVVDEAWYEQRKKSSKDLWSPVYSFTNPSYNETLLSEKYDRAELNEAGKLFKLWPHVFLSPVRIDIMHQVVRWQLAKSRQGTKSVKTISERRGTGKKPFPQKGRGKARQGSLRATHYVKGGRVHGPHPRDYSFKMNKKMRRFGIRSSLAAKFTEDNFLVVDSFSEDLGSETPIEMDQLMAFLESIGLSDESFMLVDVEKRMDLFNLCQELPQTTRVLPQLGCTVYDILLVEKMIITTNALVQLQERIQKNITRWKDKISKSS